MAIKLPRTQKCKNRVFKYIYWITVTRYPLPKVITIPISHWLLQVLPSEKEMKRDLMNNAIYNEYNLQELEATFTYVSQVSYLIVTIFVSNLCVSPLAGRCSDTKIFHLFCEIWWTKFANFWCICLQKKILRSHRQPHELLKKVPPIVCIHIWQ